MNLKNSNLNGLALLKSSHANLDWWLNTSHASKLTKQGLELLLQINSRFIKGINNIYQYKRPELVKEIDTLIEEIPQLDPYAQALDLTIILNQPENQKLDLGRVIKATPFNITNHAQ